MKEILADFVAEVNTCVPLKHENVVRLCQTAAARTRLSFRGYLIEVLMVRATGGMPRLRKTAEALHHLRAHAQWLAVRLYGAHAPDPAAPCWTTAVVAALARPNGP